MASPDEFQALVKVSSEIDESDIKITYAYQCIKGQEYLSTKLKQEIRKLEEQWNFINNDNRKIETETRNAENEVKCLSTSHEAIKSANVELRKELLLAKESYMELVERVKDGEKKYEQMWVQAKQRYESIRFVQDWMEATKRAETLQKSLNILNNEAENLDKEILKKRALVREQEQKQIIHLAEFLVQRQKTIGIIREKQRQVAELSKQVESMKGKQGLDFRCVVSLNKAVPVGTNEATKGKIVDENWCDLSKIMYGGDSLMLPKLTLPSIESDKLNAKLDIQQVSLQVAPIRRKISFEDTSNKRTKTDENLNDDYISCYFNKPTTTNDTDKIDSYSSRKLINILDDVKLDDDETYDIVSKINLENLQGVEVIRGESPKNGQNGVAERPTCSNGKDKKEKGPIESDVIEEIDLTNRGSQNILLPPSPFVDIIEGKIEERPQSERVTIRFIDLNLEEGLNTTQEKDTSKKRVSFDIPTPMSIHEISDEVPTEEQNEANVTMASDISQIAPSVDDPVLNEMMLKKDLLDLSPQFIYAKNNVMTKKFDEGVVTSKFFDTNPNIDENQTEKANDMQVTTVAENNNEEQNEVCAKIQEIQQENAIQMAEDKAVSGVNSCTKADDKVTEKPISGLLFTHGPQGAPECLEMSLSTTYDDADPDYLHCLDASLLLSPKGDNDMQPISGTGTAEGRSQEVPNFLAGFKKAGMSFFNQSPTVTNPDPDVQKLDNFNFHFGSGEEKKNKTGLFSFFR